jgi:hypothetical protein
VCSRRTETAEPAGDVLIATAGAGTRLALTDG